MCFCFLINKIILQNVWQCSSQKPSGFPARLSRLVLTAKIQFSTQSRHTVRLVVLIGPANRELNHAIYSCDRLKCVPRPYSVLSLCSISREEDERQSTTRCCVCWCVWFDGLQWSDMAPKRWNFLPPSIYSFVLFILFGKNIPGSWNDCRLKSHVCFSLLLLHVFNTEVRCSHQIICCSSVRPTVENKE